MPTSKLPKASTPVQYEHVCIPNSHPRGHVGAIDEELREVDVDVARALRDAAAARDPDHDQEATLDEQQQHSFIF